MKIWAMQIMGGAWDESYDITRVFKGTEADAINRFKDTINHSNDDFYDATYIALYEAKWEGNDLYMYNKLVKERNL